MECYTNPPLARATIAGAKAERIALTEAAALNEQTGHEQQGTISGHTVQITSRDKIFVRNNERFDHPPDAGVLDSMMLIDRQ